MLTISHSYAEGTLIDGTTRGDGTAEILKAKGWRWFRSLGMWGVQQSRDKPVDRWKIEATTEALRAAGFEVTIDIDDTPRAMEDREADRAVRAEARSDALADKAMRRAYESSVKLDRAHEMASLIPFGQPVLMDHYSAGRDMRYRKRIQNLNRQGFEAGHQAEHLQARADTAGARMEYRENPARVARRLEKLEADRRGVQRDIDGHTRNFRNGRGKIVTSEVFEPATGGYRERLTIRVSDFDEQIRYWRAFLDQAKADGRWNPIDPASMNRGDFVRYANRWHKVVRVNKTTVSVETGYSYTDKIKHHEIQEHRKESAATTTEPEKSSL
ncbi:MAG: DUF3560 domain-containing protein [Candidatus Dormibacteria bacterium]